MRVLDQTVCKPFGSTEISTFAFSKFWFFMFTKHCQALLLEKPKLGYRNFFLQKIKITPKRLSVFIEIPALSLPMYISSSIFSVSLYSFMYICYPVLSVSMGSLFSIPTSALIGVFVLHLVCHVTILLSSFAEFML